MKSDNSSYDDIEKHLPDWIKERLVFDSLKDSKLSIREKCENGKLVEYIINSLVAEEGDYPRVADMVSKAKDYIEKIEREK